MNTFEITLQRRAEAGWPVVVEQRAGDGALPVRGEGTLALEPASLLALETDPHAYGAALGEALFRDRVRDAFTSARARVADPTRVLLNVEAPDLKTLRWERLCAPLDGGWEFLALDQRVPFSLYLPSLTDRLFPPFGRRDLRALILVASPEGLDAYGVAPFDAAATIAGVQAALGGDIPSTVLAAGEGFAGPPTLDALCEAITADAYTLLHIVCHGRVMREGPNVGETVLYLAGADGGVAPVAASELIARLKTLGGARGLPHLAFLCACESASAGAEAEGALGGLAQRMVRDLGMPAVVAMSDRVSVTTAEALAGQFYRRLREHGEVDRALVEATAGLAGRPDATVPALYSRLSNLPLFSDSLARPLTNAEIGDGLDRLAALLPVRAPVLAPELAAHADELRSSLGADPAALSPAAAAAREEALSAVGRISTEVADLTFPALALGQAPPAYDGRQPFRGLSPFGIGDSEFFFGREVLVARLAGRLAEHPFLSVLGPSGSGKSSVVLAGLVPALGGEAAVFSPGADPVAQLQTALGSAPAGALVVVNQFEELFTQGADETARQAFMAALLALVPARRVVLTMRADFWGDCAPYPALREAMQAHQELIAPMDAAELRRAMELGAAAVGLRFEADLSTTLLDEVAGEPGAMPLLQQALLELWKRRHGRWLLTSEYRAIGGVREAIAHTADELYAGLPGPDQARVQDIFVRLTRLDDTTAASGPARDTRRRVGLAELVPAGADPEPTRALVATLADARLVVTSVNAVTGEDEVEVIHEALIRYWPRLRTWLDEGRANLRLRDAIRAAALDWRTSQQSEALLVHRAGRLEDAVRLSRDPRYALNALEQAYVDAAVALQTREQQEELEQARALAEEQRQRAEAEGRARTVAERAGRRQRTLSIGLALLVVAAIVTAGFAVVQQQEAVKARGDVEVALATAKVAEAQASAQAAAADEARQDAVTARDQAVVSEKEATTARDEAVEAQREADQQRDLAETQAKVARSRQLAAQSSELIDRQFGLALLLGVEASRAAEGLDGVASFEARHTLLTEQLAHPGLDSILVSDGKPVSDIAFGNDGTTLVSAGDAGITTWDLASRTVLRTLPLTLAAEPFTTIEFSPDGKVLAQAGEDGSTVWDVATGKTLLNGPATSAFDGFAFSPDGTAVAFGGDEGITVLDIPTGNTLLRSPESRASRFVFSSDGKTMAAGGDEGITVWDVATGQRRGKAFGDFSSSQSFAISPDGKTIAFDPDDSGIALWDVVGGKPLAGFSQDMDATSIAFSPDGKRLAASDWQNHRANNSIVVWDVATRERFRILVLDDGDSGDLASFSPDGTHLTSIGNDGIVVWDVEDQIHVFVADPGDLTGYEFSRDGKTLASASSDGTIRIWNVTDPEPLSAPFAASGSLFPSIALSRDGKMLAAGTADRKVTIWDVASRKPSGAPFTGQGGEVTSAAFSWDGKAVAAGGLDGTVSLWEVASGKQLFARRVGPVYCVALSPNGRILAAGVEDGVVLWDVVSSTTVLATHGGIASTVAFSPDGTLLASSGEGGIQIIDVTKREPAANQFSSDLIAGVIAFSPDGQTLALGGDDGVTLWDVGSWKQSPAQLSGPLIMSSIVDISFSLDGKRFAALGYEDETVTVWDFVTRQPIGNPLNGYAGTLSSIALSPDGTDLAVAGDDGTVRMLNLASGKPAGNPFDDGRTTSIAFSDDGKVIASGRKHGSITLWDAATRTQVGDALPGYTGSVNGVAFRPNTSQLASANADGTVLLWDVVSKTRIELPLPGDVGPLTSVAFTRDGTLLAAGGAEGITVWDMATRVPVLTGPSGPVTSVAFTLDGTTLAAGSPDGTVILWDVANQGQRGEPLGTTDPVDEMGFGPSAVYSVAFSPDARILATGGERGIALWDVASGQPSAQLLAPDDVGGGTDTGRVSAVAFSPDGILLASIDGAGTLTLWDMSSRKQLGRTLLQAEAAPDVTFVARPLVFSPDGTQLAAADFRDGSFAVWDVATTSWEARSCHVANRNLTDGEWTRYFPEEEYRSTCPDLPPGDGVRAAAPTPSAWIAAARGGVGAGGRPR